MITLSSTGVHPGDNETVSGTSFPACAPVLIALHSISVALGSTTTNASGAFTAKVVIPDDTAPGCHTITATSGQVSAAAPLTVTAAGASAPAACVAGIQTMAAEPVVAASTSTHGAAAALAFTGSRAALETLVGLLLVLFGGLITMAARRRSRLTAPRTPPDQREVRN